MQLEDSVGREAEARALVASVSKGRSCLLVGGSGMGKSALYSDFETARKRFGKLAPNNETKARLLVNSPAAWKEHYTRWGAATASH